MEELKNDLSELKTQKNKLISANFDRQELVMIVIEKCIAKLEDKISNFQEDPSVSVSELQDNGINIELA